MTLTMLQSVPLHRRLSLIFVALTAFGASAATEPPPLQITVTKEAVSIANVTAGGTVVLFSCSRDSLSRTIAVRPETRVLTDDDRNETILYVPANRRVSLRSVWIAVDEATGRVAAGARDDFPLLVRPIGAGSLKKDIEGAVAAVTADQPRLVFLLVRPGKGAWVLTVFDGKDGDRDGQGNARIQLNFEDMTTIDGKDTAPKHLQKNDVIAAIDPGHLDVFITNIDQ